MNASYIAKPLGRHQIDQAFPVVQTLVPELDIDRWRAYALLMLGNEAAAPAPDIELFQCSILPTRGIVTVQNDHDYIHGLFSYRRIESLRHGTLLFVENFIVVDLFRQRESADTLLQAIDHVAGVLKCGAIHTGLPDNYDNLPAYCSWVLDCFRAAGHSVETLVLCKQNRPAAGAPTSNTPKVVIPIS